MRLGVCASCGRTGRRAVRDATASRVIPSRITPSGSCTDTGESTRALEFTSAVQRCALRHSPAGGARGARRQSGRGAARRTVRPSRWSRSGGLLALETRSRGPDAATRVDGASMRAVAAAFVVCATAGADASLPWRDDCRRGIPVSVSSGNRPVPGLKPTTASGNGFDVGSADQPVDVGGSPYGLNAQWLQFRADAEAIAGRLARPTRSKSITAAGRGAPRPDWRGEAPGPRRSRTRLLGRGSPGGARPSTETTAARARSGPPGHDHGGGSTPSPESCSVSLATAPSSSLHRSRTTRVC